MKAPSGCSTVFVTCSCKRQQEIPLDAIYQPIVCPACGESSRLSHGKIAEVEQAHFEAFIEAIGLLSRGLPRAQVEIEISKR